MSTQKKEIINLIDSFYDGTLSPEGVNQLSRLLSATRDLSPEMEAVKKMIDGFSDYIPEPPDNLLIQLEKSIDALTRDKQRLHLRKKLFQFGSIAAAVALVLLLTIGITQSDRLSPSSATTDLISLLDKKDSFDVKETLEEHVAIHEKVTETTPNVTPTPIPVKVTEPAKSSSIKKVKVNSDEKKKRGARRITDPDEALAFAQTTINTVYREFETSDKAIKKVIEESENINRLLTK